MKRVFYWAGMTLCIAIGIGIYQLLQYYYGAFAEVTVGQLVLADDTISDAEPALALAPNEAKEGAESSKGDRTSSKAGGREETVGDKVPVAEVSPASIAPTLQSNSVLPSERDESSVDTDQQPESSRNSSEQSGEHNYYGEGTDGRRAFGGWWGGPFPTPRARDGGTWSKGVGITWSKDRDVLRGFSQTIGDWSTIRIKPPEQVAPIVGVNVAAVPVGSNMAAFSGVTCTWDLLKPSQPFTSQPEVGQDLVIIRSADHVYTFAATLGKWMSPTDNSLNADSPTAAEVLGTVAISEPIDHHNDGHSIAQLEEAWGHAERKTIEVAQRLQRGEGSDDELEPLQKELREAVESAFSARRMLQTARMDDMQTKLCQIKTALETRELRRDRIIERRVEELQDPGLNWQSLGKAGATSSTVRNLPKNISRQPLAGPGFLSAMDQPWGTPATGTPVGLPGPPNIPLASPPDEMIVVDLYGGKDVLPQMNTNGPNKARHIKLLKELNAIRDVAVNVRESGPGNEIMLAIVRDPAARLEKETLNTGKPSETRLAISKALDGIPGVRWEEGGHSADAGQLNNAQDSNVGRSTPTRQLADTERMTNANPPTDAEFSSPPALSSSSPTAAKSLPAFDWEKADNLEERMGMVQRQILQHRKGINIVVRMIEQLNVTWDDASAEQRGEVERLLRSNTSRGKKLILGDEVFGLGDGTQEQRRTIAEDKKRYNRLRLERLKDECDALEMYLDGSASALADLSRHWGQYQGRAGELELRMKEAELVGEAAHRVLELKTSRNDLVGIDQVEMINAKLAVDRAMIGLERARNHFEQLQRIRDEHPGFDPDQYQDDLARFQKLLDKVREENPELELHTPPGGSGGGFF